MRVHSVQFHLHEILEHAKLIHNGEKVRVVITSGGGQDRNCLGRGMRKLSGVRVMFHIVTVVWVSPAYVSKLSK